MSLSTAVFLFFSTCLFFYLLVCVVICQSACDCLFSAVIANLSISSDRFQSIHLIILESVSVQGLQSHLTRKEPILCKNESIFWFDFFFLIKALYMTYFVSKFHATGSIGFGDISFLRVRSHNKMGSSV